MEDENIETKKSSDGRGILVALMVLILVLIMTVAAGVYFLIDKISSNQTSIQKEQTEESKSKTAVQSSIPITSYKVDINDLVLNLADSKGREKIMKLSFSIKSSDPNISTIVNQYMAEIQDIVISQVSARSSDELLTVGGKNLFKDELVSEINNVLNYITKSNRNLVESILFTSFVIR